MDDTPMPFAAHKATPEEEAETLHWDKPTKPKGGGPARWLVALLAAVAVALGAGAYLLWQDKQALASELETLSAEHRTLREEKAASDARATQEAERAQGLEGELGEARTALDATQQELDVLEQEVAATDAQMRELEDMAKRFQRMIDSGKLSVTLRRGRMVVDLPAQVLFPSGKAELSDEGKKALRQVARILRRVRGKRFIVAGHTDNQKLTKKAPFNTNWELSAARAVVVTEALVGAGLPARRLVAAGYGPHDPVASNRREAGRQKNRRIEIILEPRVRGLPEQAGKRR